jgi:hypothetical protein
MLETTWDRVAALRLRRHHLLQPAPRFEMLAVVSSLVGVQAQVMSSAELAVGVRVAGLARADIADALWRERTLVKTWAMRGTLHLVAAPELPELVAALGTRTNHLKPIALRYFGATAEQHQHLLDAISTTLTAEPMTRAALASAVAERIGDPEVATKVSGSWGTFFKPAAGRGLLCFGPDEGRNVTFVRPSAWLGREMPEPSQAAVAAVIDRHLAAFPGSSKSELARWWGVSAGDLRPALDLLADRITTVSVEGTKALVRRADLGEVDAAQPATGLRLLGGFDPYTLSLEKAAEPLLPRARRSLVSREAGWISAVLLDGGRIAGTWTHEITSKAIAIRVTPWRRLSNPEARAVEAEATAIGGFLATGLPVQLILGAPLPA